MLDQVSNESSTSSHHLSILENTHEIPGLIPLDKCLPTFAEVTATTLHSIVIPNHKEPPSFHLSTATHEVEQEFPPVSLRTAKVLLHTHLDINEAIHAVAYRLIATIHHCTLYTS